MKLIKVTKSKRRMRFWRLLFDTLIDAPSCLSPDPEGPLSDQTITVETAGKWFCGELAHSSSMWPMLASSYRLSLVLRLLPCAARHAFLLFNKAEFLRCVFSFPVWPVRARPWWIWLLSAVRDSLMVEMKSRKRSFGKRGFSRPLKYSFSTPATELMSCSFWSSIRGSSPDWQEHVSFQWRHLMKCGY